MSKSSRIVVRGGGGGGSMCVTGAPLLVRLMFCSASVVLFYFRVCLLSRDL